MGCRGQGLSDMYVYSHVDVYIRMLRRGVGSKRILTEKSTDLRVKG